MNPLTTVKWPLIIASRLPCSLQPDRGFRLQRNEFRALAAHRVGNILDRPIVLFQRVQTPAMAAAAADKGGPGGAGVNKYVAPLALLWFRWSALATWLMGAWLLSLTHGRFVDTFTFGLLQNPVRTPISSWDRRLARHHHVVQCLGAHLPNQKKILG